MSVTTYEGTVSNGQIRLDDNVPLPDNARVFVVVPDSHGVAGHVPATIRSPKLVDARQLEELQKTVVDEEE